MTRGWGAARDRIVNALLGIDLREHIRLTQSVPELINGPLLAQAGDERERFDELHRDVLLRFDDIDTVLRDQARMIRGLRDDTGALRLHLELIRASGEYAATLRDPHPLVTVRIASYQNTEALMGRALASVLRQTYDKFEIVVVNDGPNEITRAAIVRLNDPRVRYIEFSERNEYPEHDHHRWMVAGSPGMNAGAAMARGRWIAPLDDDDEFTPDHLEKLISVALENQVELAYGALTQLNVVNNTQTHIFSTPPKISQFSFQGALYMTQLNGGFVYDEKSWMIEEPGDWNLIRRMSAAGVRMASTPDVVALMHQTPYTHKNAE